MYDYEEMQIEKAWRNRRARAVMRADRDPAYWEDWMYNEDEDDNEDEEDN